MDEDMMITILQCFGLENGLLDRRSFKKQDLIIIGTIKRLEDIKTQLQEYYLPCKSHLYLEDITVNKAITILRQVLRLFDYHLTSKERNINNKKIIFYSLESDKEVENNTNIKKNESKLLYFN